MGIYAAQLSLSNFRSFTSLDLELNKGITVLVGKNAAGKTNIIESLQLLTSGSSFRKPITSQLVLSGQSTTQAKIQLIGEGRVIDTSLEIKDDKRRFYKNNKVVKVVDVRGILPSVLFCPDHLDLVKRSAETRRDALDSFGIQLNKNYAKLSSTYNKIVEQRNNLLKNQYDPVLMQAWDESLISTASILLLQRKALLERIKDKCKEIYSVICPGEEIDLIYQSSIGEIGTNKETIEEQFYKSLQESKSEECIKKHTLVGPHRDDILFTLNGQPARDFGSQGQQRSFVLAWKLAEVEVTHDILGYYPLLLLDDVMSELDESRREAIMGFINQGIQTVITTTNLGYFSQEILNQSKVVYIGDE